MTRLRTSSSRSQANIPENKIIMSARNPSTPLCKNPALTEWVNKMAALLKPANIHWVDGSQEEYDSLCNQLVAAGTFTKLNEKLWPGCFYAKSDPGDVSRVEERTYICSRHKDDA